MLRTRLPHLWIAMIAITFVISGCGQPTRMPSSTPSQPPVTDTFSPTATATQTPTDTPRPSPTNTPLATRTPTPIPVEPGEWLVQAVNFGEFLIEYTPRSSSVSLTSVEFSGFQCDNLGIDGKWLPDSHTSKVVDGRFEMSGRITGYMELSFNTPPGAVGVINFPDVVIKGVISDSWNC